MKEFFLLVLVVQFMYAETLNIFFPSQPMHEDPAPAPPAPAVNLGSSKKQSSDLHHQKPMEIAANKTSAVKDSNSKPPLVKVGIN